MSDSIYTTTEEEFYGCIGNALRGAARQMKEKGMDSYSPQFAFIDEQGNAIVVNVDFMMNPMLPDNDVIEKLYSERADRDIDELEKNEKQLREYSERIRKSKVWYRKVGKAAAMLKGADSEQKIRKAFPKMSEEKFKKLLKAARRRLKKRRRLKYKDGYWKVPKLKK